MTYKELNPNEVQLPKQVRKFKVVSAEKRQSLKNPENYYLAIRAQYSGNPPQKLVNGKVVEVDGLELGANVMLFDKCRSFTSSGLDCFHASCGLPLIQGSINHETIDPASYVGLSFRAESNTKLEERKNEVGEAITDPDTGKPLMRCQHEIIAFFPAAKS